MSGGEELSVIYRQIFGISRTVRIEFLGVWVSSDKWPECLH
jgi:hypothetical protein